MKYVRNPTYHTWFCCLYYTIALECSMFERSALLYRMGKARIVSLLVSVASFNIINSQPFQRIVYWLYDMSLRDMIFEYMSKEQQLNALIFHATSLYDANTGIVKYILDNIQMSDSELLRRVHPDIISGCSVRRVFPGDDRSEQGFILGNTNNTREYASHPRVLQTFIKYRGWSSLLENKKK